MLVERLWGKDVFVDTEHRINTAIRKIRLALRDDPEQPRFVQTVSGKGYRFIAECQNGNGTILPVAPVLSPLVKAEIPAYSVRVGHSRNWHRIVVVTLLSLILIAGVMLAFKMSGLRDRLLAKHQIGPIHSLAVLPLVNLSGDSSQDYFADGMTDELITALAKNHSLRVASRTSAMQYKGVNRPLPDIARELGVNGILEGSVERSANHVHMTVQLIYAPTDTHIWAESYDRNQNGALSLPAELSQTIAKEIKVATSSANPQRYVNPEAHDAYLRGLYFWYAGDTKRSEEYFEKAIQIQPDYAAAWAGCGDAIGLSAVDGEAPPQETFAKCSEAVHKAVELDDSLPEAHNSLAGFYFFSWDLHRAESEVTRGIELDPNYALGHHLYSYILSVENRDDEALREQKRYNELDPFAEPWVVGRTYIYSRQYDAAIENLQVRAAAMPNESTFHFLISEAYWLKGMWNESERELEKGLRLTGDSKTADAEHEAFERGGEKAVEQLGVDGILARARKRYVSLFDIATQYAFLGDIQQTLQFLQAAYQERSPELIFLQKEPVFDFLHSDPHYRTIVKKMGLPPAY